MKKQEVEAAKARKQQKDEDKAKDNDKANAEKPAAQDGDVSQGSALYVWYPGSFLFTFIPTNLSSWIPAAIGLAYTGQIYCTAHANVHIHMFMLIAAFYSFCG